EHSPAGGGQECPRSCRRVRRNTDGRERGRPRPHQRDNRSYDVFRSCKSCARMFTDWNNVSVPISASEGFHRRLRQPPIETRVNLRATPQPGGKTQTTSLSLYLCPHPDNESVTLFASLLDVRGRQAACTESIQLPRIRLPRN
ncbi:MAG: hypothetical protein GX456_07200, partial [Verrucomicrobia bacterium]|nr:hypothetical protein [Verrucomicrobiota bacterium]